MKKFGLITLILIYSCACSSNKTVDCSLVLCATGDYINLELIVDGENVISNGMYTEEDITVTGDVQENIQVQVFSNTIGTTSGLLEISNPDWGPEQYSYIVQLGNDWEFTFEVGFTVTNYPCCGDNLEIISLTSNEVTIEHKRYSSFYTVILN